MNLPFSVEAEQSVLGAILLDSECLVSVMDIIPNGDYFHLSTHRIIYGIMIELFTLSRPVDLITILDRLKGRKELSEGDAKNYLMQLASIVTSISRVEEYAKIVRDK